MTDRENFEDIATIDHYIDAIPPPNTAYRTGLRAELATAPLARRNHLLRLRWRWTIPASAGLAAIIAIALLLVPLGPHHETPLNPRSVLARAVSASTDAIPYRGSSEMSFVAPQEDAPHSTAKDLGSHRIVSSWAVRDMTHWRVNIHILQPALQSEHQVAVANGSWAIWYRGLTNRAARYPLTPPQMGGVLLSMLQGRRGVPLVQTLEQYLQALNNPRTHTHARVIGGATILGRAADVIEIWPVVTTSSTGPCNNAQQCAKQSKEVGYGRARLWIDHEHGLLLRYQEYGLPANNGDFARHFVYRVTSVSFGSGPTPAELSYRPPVPPISVSNVFGASHSGGGFGSAGPHARWQVPVGFIVAGPPSDEQGHPYTLAGSGQADDTLFRVDSLNALYLLNWTPSAPSTAPSGPFVYVQEQYRATGLPAQLSSAGRHAAGRCTVYTGAYPDGLRWMALAEGKISLLALADRLSERDLVHWAARQICE